MQTCTPRAHAHRQRLRACRHRQPFGTNHGGMAKLHKIDEWLSSLTDQKMNNELKKHAKKCCAQQLRRPPILPFHHVVFDPMHGIHNEINVLLDEAVHQHLMVDDPSVKATIEEAQKKINKEWADAHLGCWSTRSRT